MGKKLLNLITFLGVVGILTFVNSPVGNPRKLYDKVSNLIDINKDGASIEEWEAVYETLEKPYDKINSNPKIDFSESDLKKYLERTEIN